MMKAIHAAHACGIAAAVAITAGFAVSPATAAPHMMVRPGTVIIHSGNQCTVGFTGIDKNGAHFAFTAGHCRGEDTAAPVFNTHDQPIGHFAAAVAEDPHLVTTGTARGYGVIKLYPDVAVSSVNLDYGQALQGLHTAKPGEQICHIGSRSGLHCGAVSTATKTEITARMTTTHGDSGGPAFTPTGQHTYRIVGIVDAELDNGQTTLIDPIDQYLSDVHAGYGSDWSPIATRPSNE